LNSKRRLPQHRRNRDHRLAGRAWTRTERRRDLRHAIEIRHPSFLDPAFVALLRRHRIALVFADSVAWPYTEDLTADFGRDSSLLFPCGRENSGQFGAQRTGVGRGADLGVVVEIHIDEFRIRVS
jgi:hypothetical protein